MAYNPGVQDRSGEILAQGISQGFSSLTQGVERYYKKKEEKEILDSTVSSLMSRASTSPKLAQYIGGVDMSDKNAVRAGVLAAGGGDAMAGARMLRQSLQQFGEFERQEQKREENQNAFNVSLASFTNGGSAFVPGVNYTPELAQALSTLEATRALTNDRNRAPAPKLPEVKSIKETGADGRFYDVTYQYNPDGTTKELARQETGIPSGFNRTPTGDLQPTPGGPAAIAADEKLAARNEKSAEKAEETRKAVARAASMKAEISQAVQTVNEAIDLVRGKAGGPVAGLTPIRAINAALGQSDAKVLNSKYTTIQAFTKLNKLSEIRELSKTGASGLGNLTDKEGVALESSVALLDPSLPEEEQLANLKKIKANLMRLGGVPEPGQPGRTATQVGRFTIIPQP
jgi:hypothetical protein